MSINAIRSSIPSQFNRSTTISLIALGSSGLVASQLKSPWGFLLSSLLFATGVYSYFNEKKVTNQTRPQSYMMIDVNSPMPQPKAVTDKTDIGGVQFVSRDSLPGRVSEAVVQSLPRSIHSLDLSKCQPVQDMHGLVPHFPRNLLQLRVSSNESPTISPFNRLSLTCPNLKKLDVVQQKATAFCTMNFEGMQHLKSLEQLNLRGVYLTQDQVAKIPLNLKVLRMSTEVDSQAKGLAINAAIRLLQQRKNLKVTDHDGYPWQANAVAKTTTINATTFRHPVTIGSSLKSHYANASETGYPINKTLGAPRELPKTGSASVGTKTSSAVGNPTYRTLGAPRTTSAAPTAGSTPAGYANASETGFPIKKS